MKKPKQKAQKIYFGIKYHADLRNKQHIEQILKTLEDEGHQAYCVVRDLEAWGTKAFSASDLMTSTFEVIRTMDVMLIDLSEKGVGLGIEAGYAHALKKIILVIAKEDSEISSTLKGIAHHIAFYKDAQQLNELLHELFPIWLNPNN